MLKKQSPTILQANVVFFITSLFTLAGSALFLPRLGIGTNLWINEYIFILLPPLLLAKINNWSFEEIFRFKGTTTGNKVISVLSGICIWIFTFYLSRMVRMLLDNNTGILEVPVNNHSGYQSILLIIGVIVLAPICEEIFFRGFMQSAYEGYSRKYGYILTGLIFGAYHILNGMSEVIPAAILGIVIGYLFSSTGSIASSMLFHGAVNTCAVFLGGIFENHTKTTIPFWIHILAFSGLASGIFLLKKVRSGKVVAESGNRFSKTAVIFLLLAGALFIAVGVMEFYARIG